MPVIAVLGNGLNLINVSSYIQLIVIGADSLRRHKGLPDIQQRDSLGRRHPHAWRWWLTLICNDVDCPAVVLVRTDAVEQLATQALADGAR